MTYIQPDSIIDLYSGIPLDPDYNDTVYFATASAQTIYFGETDHLVQRLTEVSYVRKSKNTIRFTPNNWSNVIHCNYLRFKNNSFENKWFYAFINKCEYINNSTCEITFSIDVMQTWFFGENGQTGIKKSFVIRQHDQYDVIGTNIEPEPIELSEYVSSGVYSKLGANSVGFVVAIVDTNQQTTGGITGGVYSGATLYYYTSPQAINDKINQYLQHPDSVLAVYTVPELGLDNGTDITNYQGAQSDIFISGVAPGQPLDRGYKPRNNKCYTYPYTFLRVFNYEGNYADFRFEFFKDKPRFKIVSCIAQPVKSVLMPTYYKQDYNEGTPYATEGLSISSYPVCSWNSDTYATWVAQNSVPMNNLSKALESKISINNEMTSLKQNYNSANALIDLASDAFGAIASAAAGSVAGVGSNALSALGTYMRTPMQNYVMGKQNQASNKIANIDFNTSMQNAKYSASVQADTIHGTIGSGNTALALGRPGFYAVRMYQPITALRRIDSYFDMYGYAVNKLDSVNLKARPHWTYCRVSDIQLSNLTMPSDELSQIKAIFENGIRFWVKMNEVGDFNLDNSVPR